MTKFRKLWTPIFFIFSIFIFSQDNNFLKPVDHALFSNSISDYDYLLRKTLLKNENPTLALLMTSYKPESILYTTYNMNNFKYYINFKVAKSSIWEKYYDQSKSKIKIDGVMKEIDSSSYKILEELFDSNLYKTKYDPTYKEYFDGERFLFYSNRKTGFIESVSEDSNVFRTIKICEKVIDLIQKEKTKEIIFSSELIKEMKEIILSNNNIK